MAFGIFVGNDQLFLSISLESQTMVEFHHPSASTMTGINVVLLRCSQLSEEAWQNKGNEPGVIRSTKYTGQKKSIW